MCIPCHANCTSCIGPANGNCLSCERTRFYYIASNFTCISCPKYYFGSDEDLACLPCHGSCATCIGTLETNCSSCNNITHYLNY